jgi:hypothetical protein
MFRPVVVALAVIRSIGAASIDAVRRIPSIYSPQPANDRAASVNSGPVVRSPSRIQFCLRCTSVSSGSSVNVFDEPGPQQGRDRAIP